MQLAHFAKVYNLQNRYEVSTLISTLKIDKYACSRSYER